MNIRTALLLFVCLLSTEKMFSQISYGGTPLFLDSSSARSSSILKSSGTANFINMPPFDLDSILQADVANKDCLRCGSLFAYKFHTHIERGKDGNEWILADGTRIWQVGIHSQDAYSINLLFTEYHVPEGAKLFLYNADHSYIIGSFDHRNNSPSGMLPVRPVAGESIIIEYSEPADVAFAGRLVIGEVNHDYRNILRREPSDDESASYDNGQHSLDCMPDVLCEDIDETMIRATVLIMINGNTACTGTLLNNTANDSIPCLLTASHCLNGNRPNQSFTWEEYAKWAQTSVVFFNYNRPVCGSSMKATEEMSMAGADLLVVSEGKDIVLLKLSKKPPHYYNAYYAGWNRNFEAKPYTNIHHPGGAVKKYGSYQNNLTLETFSNTPFDANSFLKVAQWTIGSTHGGSSGSPLFDANHWVIGGLSGGGSRCGNTASDYFFSLEKAWENYPNNGKRTYYGQLKTHLDPYDTGVSSWMGKDPNRDNPLLRIGNADYNAGDQLIVTEYTSPYSGFIFGNNSRNIVEFAEEFNPDTEDEIELYGAYLLIPKMPFSYTNGVEIRVYEGSSPSEGGPEGQPIATQYLKPQFLKYSGENFVLANKNMNTVATESFVLFNKPIKISSKFFIAYRITNASGASFVVYNTKLQPGKVSTAWINKNGEWKRSTENDNQSLITSLAIQVLSSNANYNPPPIPKRTRIIYARNDDRLYLPETNSKAGQLFIYNVSGQLLQKIPLKEGQTFVSVYRQSIGTIGIVRIIRNNEIYTGKFIYSFTNYY